MKRIVGILLVLSVIFLIIISFRLYQANSRLLRMIPGLLAGEEVSSFNVKNSADKSYNLNDLQKGTKAVFVFKKPCSHCNGNIMHWKRIARRLGSKEAYGIIFGGKSELINFESKIKTRFLICSPEDEEKFRESLRVFNNKEHTFILKDGQVIYSKQGLLNRDDLQFIIASLPISERESK